MTPRLQGQRRTNAGMTEQSTRTINRTTQVTDPQASTTTHWHALVFIRSLVRERMKQVWSDNVTQRETDSRGPLGSSGKVSVDLSRGPGRGAVSVHLRRRRVFLDNTAFNSFHSRADTHPRCTLLCEVFMGIWQQKKHENYQEYRNTLKFLKHSLPPAKLGQHVKSRVHSLCLGTNVSFS